MGAHRRKPSGLCSSLDPGLECGAEGLHVFERLRRHEQVEIERHDGLTELASVGPDRHAADDDEPEPQLVEAREEVAEDL